MMSFQNSNVSGTSFHDGFYLRALAKRMLNDRMRRDEFLPTSLFGEAGWDVMLILFSGEPGTSDCAESLSSRIDLPLSTIMRWIAVLEMEGLVEARPQSSRSEREAVRLSESGFHSVQAYLRAAMS